MRESSLSLLSEALCALPISLAMEKIISLGTIVAGNQKVTIILFFDTPPAKWIFVQGDDLFFAVAGRFLRNNAPCVLFFFFYLLYEHISKKIMNSELCA